MGHVSACFMKGMKFFPNKGCRRDEKVGEGEELGTTKEWSVVHVKKETSEGATEILVSYPNSPHNIIYSRLVLQSYFHALRGEGLCMFGLVVIVRE